MVATLSSLPDFVVSVITLFIVVTAKWLLMKVTPHYPLSFFRFYSKKLAAKVNKPQNSASQQRIAGQLSLWITLVPVLIILWLFESLVGFPVLWHALLLYLAIDGFELFNDAPKLHRAFVR